MNYLKIFVMGAAIMRVLLITDLFSGEAREWAQIVLIVLNMVTLGSTRLNAARRRYEDRRRKKLRNKP